jgi:hypothetical protein
MNKLDLEICKFKEYKIDTAQIYYIFDYLKEVITILNKYNIDFAISGSLALILQSKKIYRKIKDIDIVLNEPLRQFEIEALLNENFNYVLTDYDKIIFNKNDISIEFHVKTYHSNNVFDNSDFRLLSYENNQVNVINISQILRHKKLTYSNRQKDIDDELFYSKFV